MKILHFWLLAFALFSAHSTVQAEGFYKWKDARGNIQYGDQPPPNVKAESMKMPAITVIENYADQWKPMTFDNAAAQPLELDEPPRRQTSAYDALEFIAPKPNQAIRANDGEVSAMISVKPPLKAGHQIVFTLDGKEVSRGVMRTSNFSNLPRGSHTVNARIIDQKGKSLKSTSVTFNVQRFSKLLNQKKPASN